MSKPEVSTTMHNIITAAEVKAAYKAKIVPPDLAQTLQERLAAVPPERRDATLAAGVFLGATVVGRQFTPQIGPHSLQQMVMEKLNVALGLETASL